MYNFETHNNLNEISYYEKKNIFRKSYIEKKKKKKYNTKKAGQTR